MRLLLAAVLALAWAGPALASGGIRVALAVGAASVEVRGSRLEVSATGACRCRAPAAWRADVVRAVAAGGEVEIAGRVAPGFRLRSDGPIRVNGRDYGGVVDLVGTAEGIAVVNELPLEEYLAGVLRAEVGERWPHEALRAQAVASRTYAAHHRRLNAGKPYHIVASTAHQQYIGRVPPSSPVHGAVRETAGQVLLLDGEVFPAFYHTESGGYTEDPRAVFAARNMPALRSVACPFSADSPHHHWSLDLPLADIRAALRRGGFDVGEVTGIEVAERSASLRAAAVTVRGTRGVIQLRGNDFRRLVGYDTLKSTLFAVAVDGGVARFAGRGWGHGVGMCQHGARGMAEQGYTMAQILEFYYPGTTLGRLPEGE